MPNNSEQLKKLAQVFDTDKIVIPQDIEQVLVGVLSIMNSFKEDNTKLNKKTEAVANKLIDHAIDKYNNLTSDVNNKLSKQDTALTGKLADTLNSIEKLKKEILASKPKDGKDAVMPEKGVDYFTDEDIAHITGLILKEIPEASEETPESIKAKLEKVGIDAEHVRNIPTGRGVGSQARNLWQLMDVSNAAPTNRQALVWNSTTNIWEPGTVSGGDVVGPASAVDNNFASFDTTTGKLIQDSGSAASAFATAAQGATADTAVQPADIEDFETTTELNARDTANRARANHTGTQTASTISDFDTEVANNSAVTANTAKVTNATHTGDATGTTSLTLATVNSDVGSFTNANVTVNAKGLITEVSNGTAGSASPLTTKGDLFAYDTDDQRLAIGADGEVLTADSATATGLKWADPTLGTVPYAHLTITTVQNHGGADGTVVYHDWDGTQLHIDTGITHSTSTNPSRITVTDAGTYQLIWNGGYEQGGSARTTLASLYRIDGGAAITRGKQRNYTRGFAYGDASLGVVTEIELTAGQYIEVGTIVEDTDGVYTINSIVADCELIIRRVDELGGAKGDAGSGGTVDVVSNVATSTILGRTTAGSGDSEELTPSATRTLLNVEDGATADQTGAQIKTAYEAEANAFTDTKNTKLDGIEASADVTDTANVTSAGALMDSELTSIADVKALDQSVVSGATPTFTTTNFTDATNKRLMTDAQETVLDNTSNTNTGDEAAASTTVAGVVELDTDAEFTAGTDETRYTNAKQVASVAQTMTNKRITARVATFVSDATPDVDTDDYDAVTITAQAVAITDMNFTGTPTNFQKIIVRIKDNGTARAITWGADFEDAGQALPTTTVLSKLLTVGFIYNTVTSKWGCAAVANES